MRALPPRQQDIIEIARTEGRVDVNGLSERFKVTPQTIRKDLNDLCEMKILHRMHGGAVYPSTTSNVSYISRREIASSAKANIGLATASLIPSNSSLILNIGTTTEQVAYSLRNHEGLMVVTNNIHVAAILSDTPSIEVIIAGGMVRKSDGGIVGAATVDFVKQFKVDYAIVGVSAIDSEGSLLDFDFREVRVAQAILAQARKRILVADAMKFERHAPVQIGHMSEIDIFVTNKSPSVVIQDICKASEVDIIVTDAIL